MVPQPEQHTRNTIDRLISQAGWQVCDAKNANLSARWGVAEREVPLKSSHGVSNYLLCFNGKVASASKARKAVNLLTTVGAQAAESSQGLRSRLACAFHKHTTLVAWSHDSAASQKDTIPFSSRAGQSAEATSKVAEALAASAAGAAPSSGGLSRNRAALNLCLRQGCAQNDHA